MPIKSYKPNTPGLRTKTGLTFEELTERKPQKALTRGAHRKSGRDAKGRISVRRRGGGHKRSYRLIDFKRDKHGVPGRVATLEYDPNRSAFIALVVYADGEKRYIVAPQDLTPGMTVQSGRGAPLAVGNCMPLESIPLGMTVHCVELQLGKGAQLARSAGTSAVIAAREGDYVHLRLPSGEVRMVFGKCSATIGSVGNPEHMNVSLGKAGRSRWMGRRPKVRGVVMNPHDHPHGGGEGRTSGGRHPVSPWGVPTKGYKTRKKKKPSNRLIVRKRREGK